MEQQYHRVYTLFTGSSVGIWLPEYYQQGTVWELELGQILFCMSASSESGRDYGKGQGLNFWRSVQREAYYWCLWAFAQCYPHRVSLSSSTQIKYRAETGLQYVVMLFIIDCQALLIKQNASHRQQDHLIFCDFYCLVFFAAFQCIFSFAVTLCLVQTGPIPKFTDLPYMHPHLMQSSTPPCNIS